MSSAAVRAGTGSTVTDQSFAANASAAVATPGTPRAARTREALSTVRTTIPATPANGEQHPFIPQATAAATMPSTKPTAG